MRRLQWSWNAINSILQSASEVKQLVMKIEFSGDFDDFVPFPEVDLVDFLDRHQILKTFGIHGAMFAALCQKNSLKSLHSRFFIPALEEVMITVRSPLNAEQKMSTLESLVRYSRKLKKMVFRVSHMKNIHSSADDYFEEICKFRGFNYKFVQIE